IQLTILFFLVTRRLPPRSTLLPYTTLFRSNLVRHDQRGDVVALYLEAGLTLVHHLHTLDGDGGLLELEVERGVLAHHQLDVALRSEEHTSELQSRSDLVCRLLLEKKKTLR